MAGETTYVMQLKQGNTVIKEGAVTLIPWYDEPFDPLPLNAEKVKGYVTWIVPLEPPEGDPQ